MFALIVFSGCRPPSQQQHTASSPAPEAPVLILTTSWPLFDMTTAVVGSGTDSGISSPQTAARVQPVMTGEPMIRHWMPAADDVSRMQNASLLLTQGAGYEPWTDRVSLPRSRVIDTAAGYYKQFIRVPDAVTHQHGPDGAHSHPGTVWATWLDPELAASQLHSVTTACKKVLPELADQMTANAARLAAELQSVDQATEDLAQRTKDAPRAVLSDGPYYQYLLRRLGWSLTYAHWPEADSETKLSEANKAELKKLATPDSGRLFLMSADRSAADAEFAESLGLTVVRIDLCERTSDNSASLSSRLQANLDRLAAAVSP